MIDIDYVAYGFTDEDWDSIPRTSKVIIRDYAIHCDYDRDLTMMYGYYETIFQVRKVEKIYRLECRPKIENKYTTQLFVA